MMAAPRDSKEYEGVWTEGRAATYTGPLYRGSSGIANCRLKKFDRVDLDTLDDDRLMSSLW